MKTPSIQTRRWNPSLAACICICMGAFTLTALAGPKDTMEKIHKSLMENDDDFREIDAALNATYKKLLATLPAERAARLKKEQLQWVKDCSASVKTEGRPTKYLSLAFRSRLEELEAMLTGSGANSPGASDSTVASTPAAKDPAADQWLKKLQHADPEVRLEAITVLQTSLDPRIPEACLPLLSKKGESVRRLAARAIGSRWHQIPRARIPVFTKALLALTRSENDGLANMARRGIALLERRYQGPMVSASPSGRWIVYERYKLPCVIDSSNSTEELLGYESGSNLSCSWGNGPLADSLHWNPRKDMVAMDMLESRRSSSLWVWSDAAGLRQFTCDDLLKAATTSTDNVEGGFGQTSEFVAWKGDALEFNFEYATSAANADTFSHTVHFRWDSATNALRILSREKTRN